MNGATLPYWLAAGGVVGALVRAIFIKHQETVGRETGFDCFLGCVIGLLWNVPVLGVWPFFELPEHASNLQRAALVALFVMVAVEIIKRILISWAPSFLEHKLGASLPKDETDKAVKS